MPHVTFPNERALCESCGYPLRGLAPMHDCPECGTPIAQSHPDLRTGPAWQDAMRPRHALTMLLQLATHPKRLFRAMRVDGTNRPARVYLLGVAVTVGALWLLSELLVLRQPVIEGVVLGVLAGVSVLGLAYIEALGVAFFSRRRGWRVPLRMAERIACYASPGLLLAAVLLLKWRLVWHHLSVTDRLPLPNYLLHYPGTDWLAMLLPLTASVLAFELFVWLGVRQMRYANAPA